MRVINRNAPGKFNDAPERRIRVTRTIVFEGPEGWVRRVLALSWLNPDGPTLGPEGGKLAFEMPRVEEEVV